MIKAVRSYWFASLKYSFIFGSCDIGTAYLDDGRQVYITWGRGDKTPFETKFEKVLIPSTSEDKKDYFEYIIPDNIIYSLRDKYMIQDCDAKEYLDYNEWVQYKFTRPREKVWPER